MGDHGASANHFGVRTVGTCDTLFDSFLSCVLLEGREITNSGPCDFAPSSWPFRKWSAPPAKRCCRTFLPRTPKRTKALLVVTVLSALASTCESRRVPSPKVYCRSFPWRHQLLTTCGRPGKPRQRVATWQRVLCRIISPLTSAWVRAPQSTARRPVEEAGLALLVQLTSELAATLHSSLCSLRRMRPRPSSTRCLSGCARERL